MNVEKHAPNSAVTLASETELEGGLSFYNRIDRYGKAKGRSASMAEYIYDISGSSALYTAMVSCGSFLEFKDYYTASQIRLSNAAFCKKHLLCPLCAIRRGAKMLARYMERYLYLTAQNSDFRPFMVTFTVKDGNSLIERYNHLKRSLKTYHKRRHRKKGYCEARKASSAVWSYEFKRGSGSSLWHPHVHAIWLCRTPPIQSRVSSEWYSITGDSFIVDVRPMDMTEPMKAFLEVFKYAIKFSDQSEADTWHCYQILRCKQLVGSFGGFRSISEPDDLNDDSLEGLPYRLLTYKYSGDRYVCALPEFTN